MKKVICVLCDNRIDGDTWSTVHRDCLDNRILRLLEAEYKMRVQEDLTKELEKTVELQIKVISEQATIIDSLKNIKEISELFKK